ncbi:hypothetical protein FHX81_0447 [Saccharothrix saharensis]|uniref:Tetratricopeptide repeat protein n=1 Tax=Saccharothrix saharensis TaxID=571190 RepID=A0A543J5U2_9PSEU|nr:hypothetical protein [Saccharothrix saharensis]TQM78191.1 hypothetical protein FHX81_0447 [Saccharothrix saharensis]
MTLAEDDFTDSARRLCTAVRAAPQDDLERSAAHALSPEHGPDWLDTDLTQLVAAGLLQQTGEKDTAALDTYAASGAWRAYMLTLFDPGSIALVAGNADGALRELETAETVFAELLEQNDCNAALMLAARGRALTAPGRFREARAVLVKAPERVRQVAPGNLTEQSRIVKAQADVAAATQDPTWPALLRQALNLFDRAHSPYADRMRRRVHGTALLPLGSPPGASPPAPRPDPRRRGEGGW